MTNRKTITKNETADHRNNSPTRRHCDKKPDRGSTIRYVQGSLLDYLDSSIDTQQKGGDHA